TGTGDPTAAPTPAESAFLATCSAEEWQLIGSHTDTVRYDPGATVIAAGSVDRTLVILVRGTLEVELPDRSGRRRGRTGHRPMVAERLDPGAVVGELSFLDGEPASATVRAVGEAEVLRLPLRRFEVLAAKDPQ